MREFQKKHAWKRRLYSPLGLIILGLFIVLMIRGTWNVYQKEKESADNMVRASTQLKTLQEQQASLQSGISRLNTSAGVEEEIRQKFEVSKNGEQVYIIVDKDGVTTTPPEETNALKKIWDGFIGIFRKK